MKRLFLALAAWMLLAVSAHSAEPWQTLPKPPPMPQAQESGMAPVNGMFMYYAVYGAGPPATDSRRTGEFDVLLKQISPMWVSEPRFSEAQLRLIAVPTLIL